MNLTKEVKKKKQFSELPDSVIERALENSGNDVKGARALLRKYFGVFLVNKVLKAKSFDEGILKNHISSKDRDYEGLYKRVFGVVGRFSFENPSLPPSASLKNLVKGKPFKKIVGCVVDLGCGVNGFSYKFLPEGIVYVGVEGVGQLVKLTNNYLKDRGFEGAHVFHRDLFDLNFVFDILRKLRENKLRVVFLFQIIDALEFFEKDFSKKFLLGISEESEFVVLSFALRSLSGKKGFEVKRKWLLSFIEKYFDVLSDFQVKDERFLILKNKNN